MRVDQCRPVALPAIAAGRIASGTAASDTIVHAGNPPAATPTGTEMKVAARHDRYSSTVRPAPRRTASVRLPVAASVGMSRRLFATRIATARSPTGTADHHAAAGIRSTST